MFPKATYDLLQNKSYRYITDIFRSVDVNESMIDNISAYRTYQISEGERPDIVSDKIYSSPDYYWTFFITNDFLKEGLTAWPLDNSEIERMVTDEYGKYSIMTFVPLATNKTYKINAFEVNELTIEYTEILNSFAGLALDEKYLPYVNLIALNKITNAKIASTKINKYDASTLQLWIEKIDNDDFYNVTNDVKSYSLEFINPYQQADAKYASVESLKYEWNEKILESLKLSDQALWVKYYNDRANPPEEGFQYPILRFMPSDIWREAYNAAYYFYDAETNSAVSYYSLMLDKLKTLSNNYNITSIKNTNTNYISYFDNQINLNDAKRSIKVIAPEYIFAFAESYEQILNQNV